MIPDMISHRFILLLTAILISVAAVSCGRRKLQPDELERNRLFAEIVYRADHRTLGSDDFFEQNLLASPYPPVSKWCAIALGRIGDPGALPWLYRAFRASDAGLRASAAFAVGEIEDRETLTAEGRPADPETRRELIRLLGDSAPLVRMRAVEALGKSGRPSDLPVLIDCIRNTRIDTAPERQLFLGLAVTSLMRIGDPAALPLIRSLAAGRDPQVQWRAANALVRMHDRSARPLFLGLLKSSDPDVRIYAVRGLGMCAMDADSGVLRAVLAAGGAAESIRNPLALRVSAVEALASLHSVGSVPAIAEALGEEPIDDAHPDQVNFAVKAAAALGTLGGPRAVDNLVRLLEAPRPVQRSAVMGLAKALKKDPTQFFRAVHLLDPRSPEDIRTWAEALGEIGGPHACQELVEILARVPTKEPGPDALVAVPVILDALARANARDLHGLLRPFLQSDDGIVLRTALRVRKIHAGEAKPWLPAVEAYQRISARSDVESKVSILEYLTPWAGEAEVQQLLRAALDDRSRNARIKAAAILRSVGAPHVPLDPGPAESTLTRLTCNMLATARLDRTVAVIETDRGDLEVELFREDAPVTTSAFTRLAQSGYYNGLTFMRVVPFFVIQGGDPRNDQEGGPGYTLRCEINMQPFARGSVGMALAGKDTGGSQFFITLSQQPHLDGGYTCFGRVVSGMQVADHIVPGDVIRRVRIKNDVTMLDYRHY
jgi:cyclophilin family peptidyl-prolyl cis-trans isomerase/HEAT repeat protein